MANINDDSYEVVDEHNLKDEKNKNKSIVTDFMSLRKRKPIEKKDEFQELINDNLIPKFNDEVVNDNDEVVSAPDPLYDPLINRNKDIIGKEDFNADKYIKPEDVVKNSINKMLNTYGYDEYGNPLEQENQPYYDEFGNLIDPVTNNVIDPKKYQQPQYNEPDRIGDGQNDYNGQQPYDSQNYQQNTEQYQDYNQYNNGLEPQYQEDYSQQNNYNDNAYNNSTQLNVGDQQINTVYEGSNMDLNDLQKDEPKKKEKTIQEKLTKKVKHTAGDPSTPEQIAEGKKIAWLAYILFFIPLLINKQNTYIRFHANEGLEIDLFMIFSIVLYVVGNMLFNQYNDTIYLLLKLVGIVLLFVVLLSKLLMLFISLLGKEVQTPWFGKLKIIK